MTQASGEGNFHIHGLKPTDVALLRNVASEAADQAVKRTFTTMGLDPEHPLVSQAIFAKLRDFCDDEELPKDFAWTRRTRQRIQRYGGALLAAIAAGAAGAVHAAWTTVEPIVTAMRNLPAHHP